jgi:hypothetical protein
MGQQTRWTRLAAFSAGAGLLAAALVSTTAGAANPVPLFITPTADWLTTVNYYRAMANVGPVVADPAMSAGAESHSCYMLYNGISHDEVPGLTGYTAEGDIAGNSGNVAVSSVIGTSARSHVELWMSGPFHAIGVLRPRLHSAGFGKCDLPGTPTWHSAATLDVIRGLANEPRPGEPILFPGNGTTTNLDRFVVESPNPLSFCGWSGQAGLPIIAMLPEAATSPTATVTGPNGPIDVCVLSGANTSGVAQAILSGDNAVVVVPRTVLAQGSYSVTVGTTARQVNWSFAVDPSAAVGVASVPVAQATSTASGFAPLPPARLVDTRVALGTSRLDAQLGRRIQIAGQGMIPTDARAVLANITVTGPTGPGFLTMWNCSAERPVVSTLNFSLGETVANASTIPLDGAGGLCAFSTVSADVVIDVSGYYSTGASGRYMPVVPARLMDSREGVGTPARLVAGQVVELPVVEVAGVPRKASAVALNVTGVLPSADGFVTAFPCGEVPPTSSLNPAIGRVTPNLVIAPVSPAGTVCFFANVAVDLVVDVVGYISSGATTKLTPTTPFRFTDTRDAFRPEVNAGQAGVRLAANQTLMVQMAGQRAIPDNARGISANLTVVDAAAAGFVTAWPCGELPRASNVNYEAGAAIANAAQLPLSATGAICIYSSSSAHVIIDVNGWWS